MCDYKGGVCGGASELPEAPKMDGGIRVRVSGDLGVDMLIGCPA